MLAARARLQASLGEAIAILAQKRNRPPAVSQWRK
jgi:hypothetical protein